MKPQQSKKTSAARIPGWRRWLILLSLLGFLVFFCPVFGGIVNPANLAAMGGFLILAAVFYRWTGFRKLLRRIWSRRLGKVLLLGSGLGLLALTALLLVLCCRVISCLRETPEEPCPTVVVLGCQVRGTAPSLLLSYRIRAAADYLTEYPEAVAILSGGRGPGEEISEAECMYRALTRMGIDPARLYLEDSSSVTLENLLCSKALMEREGLAGPVVLVSNDFHIYRAMKMAEDIGLDARGLAARSQWYSRPTYVLREALALVKYALTG
jgi:uncharacterized SAM-binding protein YcdF (DUF218 family)